MKQLMGGGICLNWKVTTLQANVAEGQTNVEKELEALREVVKNQKVGNEALTKLRFFILLQLNETETYIM